MVPHYPVNECIKDRIERAVNNGQAAPLDVMLDRLFDAVIDLSQNAPSALWRHVIPLSRDPQQHLEIESRFGTLSVRFTDQFGETHGDRLSPDLRSLIETLRGVSREYGREIRIPPTLQSTASFSSLNRHEGGHDRSHSTEKTLASEVDAQTFRVAFLSAWRVNREPGHLICSSPLGIFIVGEHGVRTFNESGPFDSEIIMTKGGSSGNIETRGVPIGDAENDSVVHCVDVLGTRSALLTLQSDGVITMIDPRTQRPRWSQPSRLETLSDCRLGKRLFYGCEAGLKALDLTTGVVRLRLDVHAAALGLSSGDSGEVLGVLSRSVTGEQVSVRFFKDADEMGAPLTLPGGLSGELHASNDLFALIVEHDAENHLVTYDARRQRILTYQRLAGSAPRLFSFLDDRRLLLGTNEQLLCRDSAANGELHWAYRPGQGVIKGAVVIGKIVAVWSDEPGITLLRMFDGARVGQIQCDAPERVLRGPKDSLVCVGVEWVLCFRMSGYIGAVPEAP